MTTAEKTEKILACIASRGWVSCELYWSEAQALKKLGIIRMDTRYTAVGNRKDVWVAA